MEDGDEFLGDGDIQELVARNREKFINNGADDEYSESSTDEDEESESDEEAGIGLALPQRSTRGSRINALTGEALRVDKEFWENPAWDELNDNEDEDYNFSEEDKEMYEDVVDSDFDIEEEESDCDQTTIKEREKESIEKTKKPVYIDPSKKCNKLKFAKKRIIHRKRKSATELDETKKVDSIEHRRSQRETTRQKTQYIKQELLKRETRKKYIAERRMKLNENKDSQKTEEYDLTLADHLKIAKYTEYLNTQSLLSFQTCEEEKKHNLNLKTPIAKEDFTMWISSKSVQDGDSEDSNNKTLTVQSKEYLIFTNNQIPEIYKQHAYDKIDAVKPKCCITGNDAKYFDNLTCLFYDSPSSFAIIKQMYHNEVDNIMLEKISELQSLLLS